MFDVLWLLFSWLPSPLNYIIFGAFCILAVIAGMKLFAFILDCIPFL